MARISNDSRTIDPRYTKIREASAAMGENNDCSVVAIAAACGIPYEKAHAAMAARGRKNGKGAYSPDVEAAVGDLGFETKHIDPQSFINKYPGVHKGLKSVTTHHMDRFKQVWDDGNSYLLFTARHVGAVVDGVNVDWTKGRAKRVVELIQVTNPVCWYRPK
jgi:hypothetical protein